MAIYIKHYCNKHPDYQGIKKPRVKCSACKDVFLVRGIYHDNFTKVYKMADDSEIVEQLVPNVEESE